MAAKINRTGKTYGNLTVLETILGSNSKTDTYLVKCNCCGNTMIIGIDTLLKGLKCKNCRNKDRKSTYQDLIGKECNGIKVVSLAEDTNKTFADVFPNIEQGKLYYVDDESYSVEEVTEG